MQTTSITDYKLIYWKVFQLLALAFTVGLPLYRNNVLSHTLKGSAFHLLIISGYLLLLIIWPLTSLSRAASRFSISRTQIHVANWFGARKKVYNVLRNSNVSIESQTAVFHFRHLPADGKYVKYQMLCFITAEGRKLKIDSRYCKNFEQLNFAIRKAAG